MSLLLISGTGFLGSHIDQHLRAKSISLISTNRSTLNMEKGVSSQLGKILKQHPITHGIISAAMADVDECYRHPEKSRQVNVNAVVEILSLFKEYGIFPIFFSTDLVFDCKGGLNNESVPTNPSTLYASQKVEVETLIRNSFEKYLILRVSKLMSFSMHPRNIMAQVVHTIRNGTTYNAFTDQWITPVFIEDVAHIVESAIAAELSGIYHLAGKESVTRHDLAMRVCKEFHLDRRYLNPTTLAEKALTEPRGPKNTLSSDKITKALDFRFTPISEGLSKMLEVDKRDRSRRE